MGRESRPRTGTAAGSGGNASAGLDLPLRFLQNLRRPGRAAAEASRSGNHRIAARPRPFMQLPSILALAFLALTASMPPALAASSCETAIAQFRAIVDSDAQTGNLNQSVYDRIRPELRQVSAECQSGHAAEALRALSAVKHRHGYH
jgi:hypothetical protein